jgi:molecular chaperone DnaJ
MSEDYYDILGIGKDADPQSIRKAYRRKAKKTHPDASGSTNSSERFRKVEEAYETLGDARKRKAYDEQVRGRRGWAIPVDRREWAAREPAGEPARERPSFAPAAGWGSSPGFPFASTTAAEPLLEVLLSAEEAARGVRLPVDVPISLPCPECGAGGFWQRMLCFTCGGTGSIRTTKRMILNIPPGVLSGREFLIAAGDLPFGSLRVRVLVG